MGSIDKMKQHSDMEFVELFAFCRKLGQSSLVLDTIFNALTSAVRTHKPTRWSSNFEDGKLVVEALLPVVDRPSRVEDVIEIILPEVEFGYNLLYFLTWLEQLRRKTDYAFKQTLDHCWQKVTNDEKALSYELEALIGVHYMDMQQARLFISSAFMSLASSSLSKHACRNCGKSPSGPRCPAKCLTSASSGNPILVVTSNEKTPLVKCSEVLQSSTNAMLSETAALQRKVRRLEQEKRGAKEGGEQGAKFRRESETSGRHFVCTSVNQPLGDIDLTTASLKAMNADYDEEDEIRLGGSAHIGKMIFSFGQGQIAIAAYVPQTKWEALSCEEWLTTAMCGHEGSVKKKGNKISIGVVEVPRGQACSMVQAMTRNAIGFLKSKGLLLEELSDGSEPAAKRCKTPAR